MIEISAVPQPHHQRGIDHGQFTDKGVGYVFICLGQAHRAGHIDAPLKHIVLAHEAELIKYIIKSGKVVSIDIAEVSPRFDEDNQTAQLAAITIYAVINTLSALGS